MKMSQNTYYNNNYNEGLDLYFYKRGVKVIPSNSKLKRPIISSSEYLTNPISPELFETWKTKILTPKPIPLSMSHKVR